MVIISNSPARTEATNKKVVVDNANQTDIVIYPNPVTDILHVDLKNWKIEGGELFIYNMQGTMIYNQNFDTSNSSILEIPVKQLSNTGYVLKLLSNDNQIKVKRFIKINR